MKKVFGKSKGTKHKQKVVGEVRQSQLITTFGCGSIVDFVHDTVIIAGTDKWDWGEQNPQNEFIIYNENLQNLLDKDYFVKPKIDRSRKPFFAEKSKDIPAYRFPEILYCTKCHKLRPYAAFDHQAKKQIKCVCGNAAIVPSRFVAVCEKGHIEDFPYLEWVHAGKECPHGDSGKDLSLFNVGGHSGIESLFVMCNRCKAKRGMQGAFSEYALVNIKKCTANAPWLAKKVAEDCSETLKTRLRTTTNVYFPVNISALSIPPWSNRAYKKLESYYDVLKINPDMARNIIEELIQLSLPEFTVDEILLAFEELKRIRKSRGSKTQKDIYQDEYLALTKKEAGDDEYSSSFMEPPARYQCVIKKVVAVVKLTEVVAMLGFTRVKAWSGKLNDEMIAPLSTTKKKWLPSVQLNGEGIFIEFETDALRKWADATGAYYAPLMQRLEQSYLTNERTSAEYVLLHTFAHALIRQLSLECGYSAASLKEKIYSTFTGEGNSLTMAGVLIYTAAPDSDGSLGGLVVQSDPERLGAIIDRMLESARWCSSDPLCISSYDQHGQGFESLNYAACHACTLLPETSCEFRNLLLDRGALVGRPDFEELGFFNAEEFGV